MCSGVFWLFMNKSFTVLSMGLRSFLIISGLFYFIFYFQIKLQVHWIGSMILGFLQQEHNILKWILCLRVTFPSQHQSNEWSLHCLCPHVIILYLVHNIFCLPKIPCCLFVFRLFKLKLYAHNTYIWSNINNISSLSL